MYNRYQKKKVTQKINYIWSIFLHKIILGGGHLGLEQLSSGNTWYHHLHLGQPLPVGSYGLWHKYNIGFFNTQYTTVLLYLPIYVLIIFSSKDLSAYAECGNTDIHYY